MELLKLKQRIKTLFSKNNIDSSEVDYLFMEALKIDYSQLVLTKNISFKNYLKIMHYAKKRLKHEPFTKIFKRAYFYGLEFYVNKNVLSPRQETELLVENALKYITPKSKVLDICTGSGEIAISIKKNSDANVVACDISKKALKVAQKNAKKNQVDIKFVQSDMFSNIDDKFDVIVSNPPYIQSKEIESLAREVKRFDPLIALDGGKDGLEFYRIIAQNASKYLNPNGVILLEIGYNQKENVKKLLEIDNFATICLKDYENKDRIIIGKRK